MARASRAKSSLAQLERSQAGSGTELPDEVRAARGRLDAQRQAVATAMLTRDNGQAQQSLHAAENTLTVIEQFLAK